MQPLTEIEETLGDIKNSLQNLCLGLDGVRRDIADLKHSKNLSAERICDRLDRMRISLSNLSLDMESITPPGIISAHEVKHPEQIDATPLELKDDITKAAEEMQGELEERCKAFGEKMAELTSGRDSIQCLADYAHLLKQLHDEIESRRNRVESLKERRRKADKDSNEQRNAAILIAKVKNMIAPLEKFSAFVLDSYFKKRKRIISEIWKTTVAIESMYEPTTAEFKETIPSKAATSPITSALKELSSMNQRHMETHRANELVRSGNMSTLERRKILAAISKH